MDDPELKSWKLLIDNFFEGDEAPFFNQLKFIVIRHHFFRGKSLFEIRQDYGLEPEDYFHEMFMEILQNYQMKWKYESSSDSDFNKRIGGFIRNRLIDKWRKQSKERLTFLDSETEAADQQPGIQDRLEDQERLKRNEFRILKAITGKLSKRQIFIFENYYKFKMGSYSKKDLSEHLDVSVKTIEPEIRKIKNTIIEEFIKYSPYLEKYLKD